MEIIHEIIHLFQRFKNHYEIKYFKNMLGYCGKNVSIAVPNHCVAPEKIFMYDNTNVYSGSTFIITPGFEGGKFIMKQNSGASWNLTVITNNHSTHPEIGKIFKSESSSHINDDMIDVIVEEDVWIGADVVLLPGVNLGRGGIIGAGSVVRNSTPPYSIVIGNPAKVVGFKYNPEEIIEHEKALYPEEERLPLILLEKNYNKYFTSRIKEIKEFTRLSL